MKDFIKEAEAIKSADFFLKRKEPFWLKKGEEKMLTLFSSMKENVPAYKKFLDEAKNFDDLSAGRPEMSKDNYLKKFPFQELCYGGKLSGKKLVFTATSGSTGKPFYFPRDKVLDWQSSLMHEYFLRNTFNWGRPKSTLVIDSFGMGVWIGGIITYQAFKYIADRGYPVTIITPGVNKKEIFEAVKNLAGQFEQVIICGYPPFVKDVVDEGESQHGIDWKKYDMRFLFAAESFSEQFRDYIVRKTGMKNEYLHTANIYGSADIGTMAMETPICILTRKLALKNKKLFAEIFPGVNKTPTLAQFDPSFTNFEAKDGKILVSGYNAVPLLRYSIGDHGGVFLFSRLKEISKKYGIDFKEECKKAGIEKTISEMPFVYVYERADFSVKLYGAIIYPEHIREAVQHKCFDCRLTGKFTVAVRCDEKENQVLEVHLEMKPGKKCPKKLQEKVGNMIVAKLLEKNAEYKNNHGAAPEKMLPRLHFWEYEHENYFKPGGKQKWIIR